MESVDVQSAACDAAPAADSYTCWQHPFNSSQIRMHPVALRRLSDDALERVKAKAAAEIGGILWGRILGGSVVIEDAQFISSNGPLFNTTPLDARNLIEGIKCNRTDGLQLVGYFRSHIRDGLCLSAQDQAFINRYLHNPQHLFLLIRPFEMGICVGAFFFWRDGELQTDASDLEIPFLALEHQPVAQDEAIATHVEEPRFAAAQTALPDGVTPTTHANPAAHLSPESRMPETLVQSARVSTKRSWFALIGIACIIGIIAAGLAAIYVAFPLLRERALESVRPVATSPEIGLKVARAPDGQLDLTWNRTALERVHAERALLTITDGSISKQLAVDAAQLHSGMLTYFPSGSDVQFRLEITLNPGHSVAESVRVILPTGAVAEALATAVAPAISKHVSGVEKSVPAALGVHSTPPPVTSPSPFKAPAYIPPRAALSPPNSRQTRAPDLKLDLAAMTYTGLPSSLSALPGPPAHMPAPPPLALARNGQSAKLPVPKLAPPVTQPARTLNAYVPPHPIRQVMPDVKMAGPGLAAQAGKVEVQVTIDENGHVTDARPVLSAPRTTGLIVNAAITAARQWIFKPATLHGKPVAAEHRIVFDFQNQGNR